MAHRVFKMSVASVYKHYVAKAQKGLKRAAAKGGGDGAIDPAEAKANVDAVMRWQTGYAQDALERALADGTDFQTFFGEAPAMNPKRSEVTGSVCGVKVQEVADPLMREIRILDKLVDELAKGKTPSKVLRQG